MSVEKYLSYRGAIRGLVGAGGTLAFVTRHPEGQATGLYRLDADALTLDEDPLPHGGVALVADGDSLWVAGADGLLYEGSIGGADPMAKGPAFACIPKGLAPLAGGRLGIVTGSDLVILSRQDGQALQSLTLPEPGSCLAADPTGHWLAVGMALGSVAVFEDEVQGAFRLSDSARLHEGAVTALLFEPDELRFISAGADLRLLSTHARGRLEPEDKGRANTHKDRVTSLIWGPGGRLYSAGIDGAIKSWPRVGAAKPATVTDGVGKVVALALARVHDRPRLVAACDDDTLRFFAVDAAGKIGDRTHRVHDAYARAGQELGQVTDAQRREAALRELAGFGDARAVELIAAQVGSDPDHTLRLLAARLLGESGHPRATTLLEPLLNHGDEAVRGATLDGLRLRLGSDDLRPLDLALKTEKPDLGRVAVRALEGLSAQDDRALARLLEAFDSGSAEIREAALAALERVHGEGAMGADLAALESRHADLRKLGLTRLYRQGLYREPSGRTAVRRRFEDRDGEVRRVAFLLAVVERERLVRALRPRDPDLSRQLDELAAPASEGEAAKPKGKEKPSERPKSGMKSAKGEASDAAGLDEADMEPLLQAAASRSLGTCLRGAYGLALLRDPRALGLLLQLGRAKQAWARVEVCQALASLGDARAAERLRSMLHDPEAEVRDAAFTALAKLSPDDPLAAADAGLDASFEDVRRRGLQALIAVVRRQAPALPDDPAWPLVTRALNDPSDAVRSEAFKAALNIRLGGGGAATLRLVARSIHPDVRREVLNEITAQICEPWGWDLLLSFFNDPDPALRVEAFAFAVKKTRGLEPLEAALGSRYPDLRKQAVESLVKKHTAGSQALLSKALGDEDRTVRLRAIESLIGDDARPSLSVAIHSERADVRLRAAKALARHGDPQALEPLMELATAPEPDEPERRTEWAELVQSALEGLGELGDPAAFPAVATSLESPHAPVREQAARALVWVAGEEHLGTLREVLSHADPLVRSRAALGLAYRGDPSVASLVFGGSGTDAVSAGERLATGLTLGGVGEDRLVIALDDPRDAVRDRALLLLLMLEWRVPGDHAGRVLAALAAGPPRVRLTAADALERLADPDPAAFGTFLTRLVNDRVEGATWKIAPNVVEELAEFLVRAPLPLRARTARLLRHLRADEQAAFDQAWGAHRARFAQELASLRSPAQAEESPPRRLDPQDLRQLAFGAYVGLVREQGTTSKKGKGVAGAGAEASIARVRQTALARLLALAVSDAQFAGSARPVFVQALGDPNQAVRLQAFSHLQTLGMEPTALAAEALAAGYTDLGVQGLELLGGGAGTEVGRAVLERAILERRDDLAIEAARQLAERRGKVAVANRMLEASHGTVRELAVAWLSAEAGRDPAASEALRRALTSRHPNLREASALALGLAKEPSAFPALAELLKAAAQPGPQRRIIDALVALGDPRVPDVLLDRLEDDPGGTAQADVLIRAAGRFRRPENVDRLMALMENDRAWREAAFHAVLTIGGYDQPIEDPEDERPDRHREAGIFPRRDDVLARLLVRCAAMGEPRLLARLVPSARWARGRELDAPLATLVNHPDERLRREAIEALGWRFRRRGSSPEPLRPLLSHRDPISQFLAAEALARAGRSEALSVLLASVDFVTDLAMRRRAVRALGELADERALDPLLRLAAEEGHALQDDAAEAIGHFRGSSKAEDVHRLLERLAGREGSVAEHALRGLRWLGTPEAWRSLRQKAGDPRHPYRAVAVEQLGHDDDPASRDLILGILSGVDSSWILDTALVAARRIWGDDSLEPDYASLLNPLSAYGAADPLSSQSRVAYRGDPTRIFAILPRCGVPTRQALAIGLLNRSEPPVAEASAAIAADDAFTVGLAARILGRAGVGSDDTLDAALQRWWGAWQERREEIRKGAGPSCGGYDEDREEGGDRRLAELTECVASLAWASGRLGHGHELQIALAGAFHDDRAATPIRRQAVLSLAEGGRDAAAIACLEAAATGDSDPEIRAIAAQALAAHEPARIAPLAPRMLGDRTGFERLARADGASLGPVLRDAARQVHYQGVALPYLIERRDAEGLAAVAADRTLPEATRLGALEALASLAAEPAEAILRRVGADAKEHDDLRRAAWRGLRRSKRARAKREPREGVAS